LKQLFLLFFAAAALVACKDKKEKSAGPTAGPGGKGGDKNPPTVVDVLLAGGTSLDYAVEVNGTVIPYETVNISAEVSGRLTYLQVPDGASVAAGAVLARINDADLQATLNRSKVQLQLAQQTEQRLQKLIKVNGINQADYDAALNQVNILKADMAVTQAQIDKTVVKAPFAGVLGLRQVSPGAYVTPNLILTTLQQVQQVKIDFNVPELYTGLIRKGNVVAVFTTDSKFPRKATILATDPQINPTTRNLKVRAVLQGAALSPGTFVKIQLEANKGKQAIVVPTNAIIPEASAKKIIVVKNGMGSFVEVETGQRNKNVVEVTKGLSPGDSVVVSGVLFVRPKQPLKVRAVKTLSELIK
jgi:membrane fusion protein, multidrug efflux system